MRLTNATGLTRAVTLALAMWLADGAHAQCLPSYTPPGLLLNPSGFYYQPMLLNGPSNVLQDIVVMGDGFTAAEQDLFNAKVDRLIDWLTGYYGDRYAPFVDYQCGYNVWRMNVVSLQSGIDDPSENLCRNSALDCTRGAPDGIERCIYSISPQKILQVADWAPDYDTILVLANDPQPGGCAGSTIVYTYIDPSPANSNYVDTAVHELSHQMGGLADEYCCALVCHPTACDPDHIVYPANKPEPIEPNITTARVLGPLPWSGAPATQTPQGVLDLIKWGDLIDPFTPIPTNGTNPPAGTVGLWEGGDGYLEGMYHPQSHCTMRGSQSPFCAVCKRVLDQKLSQTCCPDNVSFRVCEDLHCPWAKKIRRMDPTADILRIPFPPCLSCPDDQLLDTIELYLDIDGTNGLEVVIVDEDGDVAFEGIQNIGAPLEVSFLAHRGVQYFVLLAPGEETSDLLQIETVLVRNGELVEPTDLEVAVEF